MQRDEDGSIQNTFEEAPQKVQFQALTQKIIARNLLRMNTILRGKFTVVYESNKVLSLSL